MLIETKFAATPLKCCLLFRKKLIDMLCAAENYQLVLISGPAGSGKTTLVCQWINQKRGQVAWYSLDEKDNEPSLFFRYLIATLSRTDEHLNNAFKPMLENQRKLTEEDVVPHLIAHLSTLPRDIHLVLDDFHLITNGRIHDVLTRLIHHIPARLHLVFLSRYCLPAQIDAVTLKKEKLVISASDLKFTKKEAATIYKDISRLSLSPSRIHDLKKFGTPPPSKSLPTNMSGLETYEALTQREIEILELISQGLRNKEIAQKACISVTTVKSHVSSILAKLNVRTRTQAMIKARETRILEIENIRSPNF